MNISTTGFDRAVDAPKENRPGEPMEVAPRPVGHAHWDKPVKQARNAKVTKDAQRDELTATFGTAQPPAGLSGLIRRKAYTLPDYEVKRWVLLMLADRIDWQESRLGRVAKNPLTWVVVGGAVAGALYLQQQKRSRWTFAHFIK